jgi:hypothetical protein
MKSYTYKIEQDDTAGNPRDEMDNLSRFLCPSNNRYTTGGKTDLEFHPNQDGGENLRDLRRRNCLIVEFHNPNVGTCYAFVTRDQLQKEYIAYGQTMRQAMKNARNCMRGEIETYLAWADGEVYGFVVEDEDGNHVDSCWGFYGEDGRKEAEREAQSIITWHEEQEKEADNLVLSRLQFA